MGTTPGEPFQQFSNTYKKPSWINNMVWEQFLEASLFHHLVYVPDFGEAQLHLSQHPIRMATFVPRGSSSRWCSAYLRWAKLRWCNSTFQENLINQFCFENEPSSELFSLIPCDAYDTVITYNTIWYHMVAYYIPAHLFVLLFHVQATCLHDGGHTPVELPMLNSILGQLQQFGGADQQLAYWNND